MGWPTQLPWWQYLPELAIGHPIQSLLICWGLSWVIEAFTS